MIVILILILILILFFRFLYKEPFGRCVAKTKIINNKFIHKYIPVKNVYNRIKKYYSDILHKWDFVPRMYFNDKKLIIKEDYYKTILNKSNKPSNYKKQLRNIHNTIRNAGLFHNDYRTSGPGHFYVKNNKIYLIDYDGLSNTEHLPRNNIESIIKELKN
jgi:hypothetical protein